ncbi:MAG: nicotinamide mononucleotide transporter [Bacteroidetes bacterium]|nr:nicotinamide riboside transporter PnuC [Bacteroidota bacterium]MBV6461487.1 Nicotinamide riboside transporter PnuC [Flavobacteriales bacterium]WKZ76517.1 MAG: nicotinamide riboside transporter PnuC [Vicingaceae bacterium]MCL4815656.1 nicotinamide riboside transporter PnuC [Flavobacteriales bacterium]NOG94201.1 nicotinamide mononucleotide transporter [Bacteroidota bacterium]
MENWIFNNTSLLLEIMAVMLGILYVILAARLNIYCWIFGIIGSLISIYIFIFYAKLYSEALLYLFYVIAGVYGWINWANKKKNISEVYSNSVPKNLLIILGGIIFSLVLYKVITYFFLDAQKPLIDSFTTVFSIIATYLTAKKRLENWLYWIAIDALTTYLYYSRELEIYALLMLCYTLMAAYGFIRWKKLKVIKIV